MANSLPLVLMILDGWGYRKETTYNAIANAQTPQWDHWWNTQPHLLLEASGTPVGLPDGQMGNSEVGHMHIGAGRVVPQDVTRIHEAIKNGTYSTNTAFIEAIQHIKKNGGALHVLGLLSSGGVHSHEDHLFAFLTLCAQHRCSNVYLHLFLDGRDTPPKSASKSLQRLEKHLLKYPGATISSLSGRYYAMDRDHRWERVEPVYRLLTEAQSPYHFKTPTEALDAFYQNHTTDEFIPPSQIGRDAPIRDGDAVFFFNFRSDRARQLTEALLSPVFHGFERHKKPKIECFVSMTSFGQHLPTSPAFPPLALQNTLGEVIEKQGMRQLRISETEKYAHVTFFLNGGVEQAFAHEHRILIPSPPVTTYDLQPEMSAPKLTKALIDAIHSKAYDVIICNYANADMVGHTGDFLATVRAIECLDRAMHDVWHALNQHGGQLLITADHGNAEIMFDESTHQTKTSHTNQPVPFVYVGKEWGLNTTKGSLIDIAPTILALLNIPSPKEMSGHSLLVEKHASRD
jgi:2,3-bisphosphoglycerate-independent phosphoglycerate mutase